MKLRELGEFGLIGRISGKVKYHSGVALGIGDDAAATSPAPGTLTLITSDMLVEGIHFDLRFSDPFSLGRKSLAVNLSDIAAMGAIPRSFLLSLAIPSEIPVELIDELCSGVLSKAEEFGVSLIGGDTCASPSGLVISITMMGEQLPDLVVRRSGARPGDLICVTGTLGDSALGLELLRRGLHEGPAVERHIDPLPRVREGLLLADSRIATAMIDISDGLLADLNHILECSETGAKVEAAALPLSPASVDQCRRMGLDPIELALAGGEDYELLFTIRPEDRPLAAEIFGMAGVRLSEIGQITAGAGLAVNAEGGREYPVRRMGYNHFT